MQAGSHISRFRVHNPLPEAPGELPLPLWRAQDIAARSWVLVLPFPEDAPRTEIESAVERAVELAAITAGEDDPYPALADSSADAPAHLAWPLGGGETLRQRLQRSPLGTTEAAAAGLALARALRRLHRAGAVHGSLRPANVQIPQSGRARLLAPASIGPTTLAIAGTTVATSSLWTAAYLSPEQIEAEAEALTDAPVPFTTADDVWTLGVILHELVTGELPFIATTWATMRDAVGSQAVDLVGTLPGSAPEAFEPVFEAALDRDPDRRRAALAEVIGRLRQASEQLAPTVRPVQGAVSRIRARKAAAASDRSAATPAQGELRSALDDLNERRRKLAQQRPPPALWRVLLLPLATVLALAVAVLLLL